MFWGQVKGVESHYELLRRIDLKQEQEYKNSIVNELTYNLSLTPLATSSLRGVIKNRERRNPQHLYSPNFRTVAYNDKRYVLTDVFENEQVNFIFDIYQRIEYVNVMHSTYNNDFKSLSKDFGSEVAYTKMIENSEILIDHCLNLQFQIIWYLQGKYYWNEQYYMIIDEWKDKYWKTPYIEGSKVKLMTTDTLKSLEDFRTSLGL